MHAEWSLQFVLVQPFKFLCIYVVMTVTPITEKIKWVRYATAI